MNPTSNLRIFQWEGLNTQGKKIVGEIHACDKLSAVAQLKNQPILSPSLQKKHIAQLSYFSNRIPSLVILFFFRQLATLLISGIPIIQSLIIIGQSHQNITFKKIMTSIKIDLEAGKLLGQSLRQFPYYFDNLTCHLIHIGEQTGTLIRMLQQIADHKENNLFLKKKIIQSLFYPTIILILATVITFIMLTVVVPRFAELFQNMHGKLPALTLFILYSSHFIRHYGSLIFLAGFLSLVTLKKIGIHLKEKLDFIALKMPLIGHILSKCVLVRFARNLSITIRSGMAITDALKIIGETAGNRFYEYAIFHLQTHIAKGHSLYKSMQKSIAFPPMMMQMIKIGEESGTLEEILEKLAEIYESDIDHLITNLMKMMEPLIMIILGVLISVLIIAMYLPIFKLGTLM